MSIEPFNILKMRSVLKYSIGIDLGGTFIKYGLVCSTGELLYENTLATEADQSSNRVIENLIVAARDVQSYALLHEIVPIGIGVGTPGIVDRTHRIILGGAENIVGWSDIHLSDLMEKACGLPVWINNDANLMGLGEQAFGVAKNYSDVLFLTIGTGIGGAVIIDNKLFGGYNNRGAELGHIPLFADGIPCACGSVGCLEAYASTTALVQQFKNRSAEAGVSYSEEVTGKFIINQYLENDPIAVNSLNQHCQYLGYGIAGLVNIFSPQRVVLGGGISECGNFYIEKINAAMQKRVIADCAVNSEIYAARLGNKAGTLGAAQWAFNCSSK
jgi:glucokinase